MQNKLKFFLIVALVVLLIFSLGIPSSNLLNPPVVDRNLILATLDNTATISYNSKTYDCVAGKKVKYGNIVEESGQLVFKPQNKKLSLRAKELLAAGKASKSAKLKAQITEIQMLCKMALAHLEKSQSKSNASIFDLIDTTTKKVLFNITNDQVISLASVKSKQLSFQANFPIKIGSTKISLNEVSKIENSPPYTLYQNGRGNFDGQELTVGNYKLTATPYTKKDLQGNAGAPYSVSFRVVDSSTTTPSPSPVIKPVQSLESSNVWKSHQIAEQTSAFKLSYITSPRANLIDAVTGLSDGTAKGFEDLGVIVRFNKAGNMDVRNGEEYSANQVYGYRANTEYLVELDININTQRYDVYVTEAGGERLSLANDFLFRSNLKQFNHLGYYALTGSHMIKDIKIDNIENKLPLVSAGPDQSIQLPVSSVNLTGIATDSDGIIASRSWIKISGPNATLSGQTTNTLSLSNLIAGTYIFRFSATDNVGAVSNDESQVVVSPAGIPNNPPVVNVGADKSIQLPLNSVTLTGTATDSDGTIASRSWTKVSGPNASLSGQTTNTLSLSNLVAGSYVFRFSATDNTGLVSVDEVNVIVSAIGLVSVTLDWDPVTTNTNGSTINNLAGYKVSVGTASGNYGMTLNAGLNTTYNLSDLRVGSKYYAVVRAYNSSGKESANSVQAEFVAN